MSTCFRRRWLIMLIASHQEDANKDELKSENVLRRGHQEASCEFICFDFRDPPRTHKPVPRKPYKFVGFGALCVPKTYKFIRFGAINGRGRSPGGPSLGGPESGDPRTHTHTQLKSTQLLQKFKRNTNICAKSFLSGCSSRLWVVPRHGVPVPD